MILEFPEFIYMAIPKQQILSFSWKHHKIYNFKKKKKK